MLSVAFLVVILAAPARDGVSLGRGAALVLAGLACLNALLNAARMLGLIREGTRRPAVTLQLAADAVIALAGMLLLDASATPLAWIALLLPVFDAGVAFGALAAGCTWAGLSLVYVISRLQIDPLGEPSANVLGLAVQQLAAVAIVALPTAYVAARLRDDLAHSHRARVDANRRAEELLLVAAAARRLATATTSVAVLDIALDCAVSLGFDRADVCEKQGDRPWRLLRAAGSRRGPDPALDDRLDEVVLRDSAVTMGVGETHVDVEKLRLLGYRSGVMLPVAQGEAYAIVMRAWSPGELTAESSALESVELLAALTSGAWQSVTTLSNLESWSSELARQATHDELTGLANRPHLFACVEAALETMRGTGRQFAVLFLDLDGFKEVNDELGHEAGDAVLQGIAERLGHQVRGHDVVARLGGDEFVVVLNDLSDPGHALNVADRICEAAAAPFSIGSSIVRLGASIGIAYAQPDDSSDRLLGSADRVMYEAKRMGGNRFVVSRSDAA